jgi:hypothetical protein
MMSIFNTWKKDGLRWYAVLTVTEDVIMPDGSEVGIFATRFFQTATSKEATQLAIDAVGKQFEMIGIKALTPIGIDDVRKIDDAPPQQRTGFSSFPLGS